MSQQVAPDPSFLPSEYSAAHFVVWAETLQDPNDLNFFGAYLQWERRNLSLLEHFAILEAFLQNPMISTGLLTLEVPDTVVMIVGVYLLICNKIDQDQALFNFQVNND